MSAIYDLLDTQLKTSPPMSSNYIGTMFHNIPAAESVKRERFILERVKGRRILDIGCTGPMGQAIKKLASIYYGMDKDVETGREYQKIDIDKANFLPLFDVDLVVAGEVIEHLSNPGHFLDMLKIYKCPIVLTTPNAFSAVGHYWTGRGAENVNPEHVAYYSWHTLKTLVERHGYEITEWYWYNGSPRTAEGLIFCLEAGSA